MQLRRPLLFYVVVYPGRLGAFHTFFLGWYKRRICVMGSATAVFTFSLRWLSSLLDWPHSAWLFSLPEIKNSYERIPFQFSRGNLNQDDRSTMSIPYEEFSHTFQRLYERSQHYTVKQESYIESWMRYNTFFLQICTGRKLIREVFLQATFCETSSPSNGFVTKGD